MRYLETGWFEINLAQLEMRLIKKMQLEQISSWKEVLYFPGYTSKKTWLK